MNDTDVPAEQQDAKKYPCYRIFTCGPFLIERWDGTAYQAVPVVAWGGSNGPRQLLKALLCSPGRQASRGRLLEILWSDIDPEESSPYLNDAAYRLRKVLQPRKEQESLLHTSRDTGSYALARQERLWVDADAALALLEQAEKMERQGGDAVAIFEEANGYLSRGEFLAEEEYLSFYGRRTTVGRARRGCLLALARAYGQRGWLLREEALLSDLLEENVLDEDALCVLMLNLQQQGRTFEGLRLYQETKALLESEGLTPTEMTRAVEQQLRSEIPPIRKPMSYAVVPSFSPRSRGDGQPSNLSPLAQDATHDIIESGRVLEGNVMDQLRRQILQQGLKGIGVALLTPNLFSLMQVGTMLHDEEVLSVCATSLPIFWRLYFEGQLSEVQRVLPACISQLALLVRQPSRYQQQAASVVSKAHQLACMLSLQEQDYGAALIHVDEALRGAHLASDANLKAASLIRKALVYRYINRSLKKCPDQILEAYQEAAQYISSISPLLRGRLYTGLAEAYSGLEQEDEAKHALERAYTVFPEKPQDDPNFSYTHFKLPQKFEAVMYLNLEQADKAWEALAKIDASVAMAVVPDRVELSLDQARASLLLGDMEQSCKYLEFATTSASALGSDLRYHEAYSIYKQMYVQWPREQQVKALGELFQ